MAAPNKPGVDYFPLDVDIDQDDKISLIEAENGLVGFAILIKLLAKIYHEGYYYRWTECERLLFCSKIKSDIETIDKVVDSALKWNFLNKELFESYQILTSSGIQKRYLKATTRRKEIVMIKEFVLIDIPESEEKYKAKIKIVNANINSLNVNINPESVNINPQSKVKESKVKETTTVSQVNDDIENVVDVLSEDEQIRELEKMRARIMGNLFPNPREIQDMEKMIKLLPVNQIKIIIETAAKEYKPKYDGDKIRTFSYFLPLVQKMAATVNSRAAPESKPEKPIIEKTKESIELTQELLNMIPEWMAKEAANSG